jgi:toxin CcdB
MAQWDVYPNPSARSRDDIPYLIDLQSNLLDGLPSRLVAPLARTRLAPEGVPQALCPVFNIGGVSVVLLPHEAGPIEARLLKRRTDSLLPRAHEVVAALDALVSGF